MFFLWRSSGLESERRHYDAETGEFIAAMFKTDVIDRACRGVFYWPRRLPFTYGRLTEVICDSVAKGFEMPIAEFLGVADIEQAAP